MGDNSTCVPGTKYVVVEDSSENDTDFSMIDSLAPATEYASYEIALKVIFYVAAIILDVVGNSIVIMIILLNRKMRTTTNLLVLNLAFSDLMVGVFCMWVHLGNQITSNWPFGAFLCKFSTFSQVLSVTASVLTLAVISVERFIAVVFPFRRHWTPAVTGIIIGCTWLLAIATATPQLVVRTRYVVQWRDRTEIYCAEAWAYYYKDTACNTWMYGKVIYYMAEGVVMYFAPILIIIIAYTMIAIRLLMRKAPGSHITSTSTAQEKSKKKVTRMLVIVLIAFLICWTPQQIMILCDQLNEGVNGDYYIIVRYVAVYIAYFNSALNPIIYGGFNENFRNGFSEAFKCFLIKKRNKIGPDSTMPHWSTKPASGQNADNTHLNVITAASHLTSSAGPSRDGSGLLHPHYGRLHPTEPAFKRKPILPDNASITIETDTMPGTMAVKLPTLNNNPGESHT